MITYLKYNNNNGGMRSPSKKLWSPNEMSLHYITLHYIAAIYIV